VWRLGLQGGSSVDVDEMVVKDATGRTLHRALPRVTAGQVEVHVPAAVVDHAAYPLTIDPDVSSRTLVTPNGRGKEPAVAFSGSTYLVVYENIGPVGALDIRARRLDANGALVGDLILVADSSKRETDPDVGWNGTKFLAVWTLAYSDTDLDVQSRLVSPGGSLDPVRDVSSRTTNEEAASVGASNSTFFVAWQDSRNGGLDIYGTRMDGGTPNDSAGLPLGTSPTPDYVPDVAGNDNGFLVAFQHDFSASDPDIYAQRVDRAGVVLGASIGVPIATALDRQRRPSVASDGSQWLIAFEDESATGSNVFDISGARVSSAGVSQGVFPIVTTGADQLQPSVAFRGVFLVVWWDRRSGPDFSDVYAARVQGNGTVKDPNGFAVAATTSQEDFPAVAPGGSDQKNWGVVDEAGDLPLLEFRSVSK
jgi:hypothetical protein